MRSAAPGTPRAAMAPARFISSIQSSVAARTIRDLQAAASLTAARCFARLAAHALELGTELDLVAAGAHGVRERRVGTARHESLDRHPFRLGLADLLAVGADRQEAGELLHLVLQVEDAIGHA